MDLEKKSDKFTRRAALLHAFTGGMLAVAWPATSAAEAADEPEFVPDNDYPFFGEEIENERGVTP